MPLDYNARLLNKVTSSPSNSSGIIGNDRYLCFTYVSGTSSTNYTFTITEQLNVDILVVAGAGGGGKVVQVGGGGAGGIIDVSHQTISANNYNISVGRDGGQNGNGINSSFGTLYTVIGVGRGGTYIDYFGNPHPPISWWHQWRKWGFWWWRRDVFRI